MAGTEAKAALEMVDPNARPQSMAASNLGHGAAIDYVKRIEPMMVQIAKSNVEAAQLCASLYNLILKNPALLQCGSSLEGAVMTVAATRLPLGLRAYVVPYKNTATPVFDYRGLAQLAMNSGQYKMVDVACVYENEIFQIHNRVGDRWIEHEEILVASKRGKLKGAYAYAVTLQGGFLYVYWDAEHIEKHRRQYSKTKIDDESYAMKTVMRQLCNKKLNISYEPLLIALATDGRAVDGTRSQSEFGFQPAIMDDQGPVEGAEKVEAEYEPPSPEEEAFERDMPNGG